MKNILRRYKREDDGTTAVEFALVAILFLTFVFGLFELGHLYWTWNTLQFAVDKTTRYVIVNTDLTDQEIQQYAADNMPGLDVSASNPLVTVEHETVSGVEFVVVTAAFEYNSFSGFFPDNIGTLTLDARSRMAVE